MIADFRNWLTHQRSRISTKSRLGEKPGYIYRHWDGLQVFLTDGRVEMDTNPVENTIRPITLNRKNALFAGHDESGRTWARMAFLIETCKLNAVDPYAYRPGRAGDQGQGAAGLSQFARAGGTSRGAGDGDRCRSCEAAPDDDPHRRAIDGRAGSQTHSERGE